MRFETGTRIGVFEILEPIGAGGMGEVYRARDTRLARDVAIKTLPELSSESPEKRERFQREAQLLASLNHPHIAAIHGLELQEQLPFLVLELVPGETLADRLHRGRVPTEEALAVALQIADALEAAHEKGVIHRDLKPANLKITPEGKVKVLDFGLAKAFTETPSDPGLSNSPTLSANATRAGVILGTAAYMSPEQARGKSVDKRTDVFSFGAVLYEMLTGSRLFDSDEVSEILASVLKSEPDWSLLPEDVPSRVRELLRRCLAKDPKRRIRDMGDVRLEIEEVLARPELPAPVERPRRSGAALPIVALASVVLGGALFWNLKPAPPRAVTKFALALPRGELFSYTGRRVIAVSPSGSHIAYVANLRLNLRAMDEMESKPLPGTEGARSPVFSPDGRWIAFWAPEAMKKVAVTGGAPITLSPVPNPFGVSWSADGSIVYGQGSGGVWRVSPDGGEPQQLVELEESQRADGPEILPDGKTLLFTLASGTDWDRSEVVVQSLATGARKVVVRGGSDARYVPTGHLVYAVAGTILAVPFDLASLETRGDPAPVVQGVLRATLSTGTAHFSFSQNGTLAYVPGRGDESASLLVVDREGRVETSIENRGYLQEPRFSPDGGRIAARISEGGKSDVWILDLRGDTLARLTDRGTGEGLLWSPEGEWIVYTADRGSTGLDLYRRRADLSGTEELLLARENDQSPEAWSRDGKWLVFRDLGVRLQQSQLWVLPLGGVGEPEPLPGSAIGDWSASLSPDGRFLAYQTQENMSAAIYVRPFPGPGRRWPISTEQARAPVWSSDGSEIFYQERHSIMSAKVTTSPELEVLNRAPLFEGDFILVNPSRPWDVSSDGKRFAVNRSYLGGEGARVHVVLHWFEELERLAPR